MTSLGQKDAEAMGLDARDLMHARQQFVGIGGFSVSYEIPDVDIIVSGGGEQAVCHLETVYLHRKVKRKKTRRRGPMVYEGEAVAAAPSILGYDALAKTRFKLEIDFAEDKAVLVQKA